MADAAVVGILRALLTADTANFDAGMRKAVSTSKATEKAIGGLSNEVKKLTPQAERMVKAFQGDKLLYQANNLVASVTKLGGVGKLTESEMKRVNGTLNEAIAKYKALGQTAPKALLDTEKATRSATGPTQFLTAKMVALGAAASVMVAQLAGRAIGAVINLGKEAFRSAGQIVDLSSKTGLSTKTIQQMKFVAEQTGSSLESFTNAAFQLSLRVEQNGTAVQKALEQLRKYGLEVERFRQARPDEQWNMLVAALSRVESQGQRAALGQVLVGKTFRDVSASINEGYVGIANQAKLATDAQLRELERLGDEWTKFRKNLVTGFAAAMGEVILRNRLAAELMREQLQPGGQPRTQSQFDAEVQRRLTLGLAGAKTKDIQLTAEQADVNEDYVAQLKKVQAELKNLDAAERKQIAAAQQLNADGEDITAMLIRFGISAGNTEVALKLLSGETKTSGNEAKKAGEEWQRFLDRFTGASTMETAMDLGKAIATSQINLTKLTKEQQLEIKKALEDGAEAWKVWGGVVPAQIQKALTSTQMLSLMRDELIALETTIDQFKSPPAGDAQVAQRDIDTGMDWMKAQVDAMDTVKGAARDHGKALRALDISRTEAAIRQAEREGVKKVQILQMQSILAQKQRDADVQSAEDAFEERTQGLKRETADGAAEYNRRLQEYQDHVTQINETWAQGEAERRDMMRRESSFWASELGKQISGELKGILHEITGKLASTLFGGVDGEAKQRAQEAREDYERIAKSGKASAEEITRAFRAMREAEAEAHSRWADKFKSMWDGIKRHLFNIFDEILGHFVNHLLKGMLAKLAATNLGGKLLGFLGLGGGGGGGIGAGGVADIGGGLLGRIPGLSVGVPMGAGGLGTLAGAPILNSSGAVIGTAGATAGTGAGSGAVAGLTSAIGKIAPVLGAAAGIFGLIKNKGLGSNLISGVTAGASIGTLVLPGLGTAIGAGLGAIAGGLRSLFSGGNEQLSGFGGGHLARRLGDFRAGNLRPTIPQHSFGSMGRAIAQTGGAMQQSSSTVINLTADIRAWDGTDVRRAFNEQIIPELKRELVTPRHGLLPLIQQKVLA